MTTFIDKDNRKRRAVNIQCKICQKIFATRADQPGTYCSKTCSQEAQRKRVTLSCAQCKTQFDRAVNKLKKAKNGVYFCCRTCKDQAQRLGGIEAIMPPHYGTGTASKAYRAAYVAAGGKLICTRCAYAEFACGLDIHHVDGNHDNQTKENLIALCAPCHRALHFGYWKLEDISTA